MDVTKQCSISEKYGFNSNKKNRFLVLEVNGKNGDLIKVNKLTEVEYNELFEAYEYPNHEDRPIIDPKKKVIVLGGEDEINLHTIFIIGK